MRRFLVFFVSESLHAYETHQKERDKLYVVYLFSRTPAGGRTLDTLIKSQVLYQLSYKRILLVLRLQRY